MAPTTNAPKAFLIVSSVIPASDASNEAEECLPPERWLSLTARSPCPTSLDSVTTTRRRVDFYVREYNHVLPHSAFRGQTPDEIYYGTGDKVPGELASSKSAVRRTRLEVNRSVTCEVCPSNGTAA